MIGWQEGQRSTREVIDSSRLFVLDLLQLNVSSDGTCPELASLLPQGYLLLLPGKPRPLRAH